MVKDGTMSLEIGIWVIINTKTKGNNYAIRKRNLRKQKRKTSNEEQKEKEKE